MQMLLQNRSVSDNVSSVSLAHEPLRWDLVEIIFQKILIEQVCTLPGPSGAAACSTLVAMRRQEGFSSHIGRSIANTRISVLEGDGQPLPIGVVAEMHIGGAGVARGYLNLPELTAERFLPDPCAAQSDARMYRTGELARWLPDGNLEYIDRADFQVKIDGFRIELGEIEATLRGCEGIREAVVLAREGVPGEKRLVAYFTVADRADTSAVDADVAELPAVLKLHLRNRLPVHMAAPPHPSCPNGWARSWRRRQLRAFVAALEPTTAWTRMRL